jgi:hypothetical protein
MKSATPRTPAHDGSSRVSPARDPKRRRKDVNCPVCGLAFEWRGQLEPHLARVHDVNDVDDDGEVEAARRRAADVQARRAPDRERLPFEPEWPS